MDNDPLAKISQLENQIARLNGVVSDLAALLSAQNAQVQVHECLLIALATLSHDRPAVLEKMRQGWQLYRGSLGLDTVSDQARQAAQATLTNIGRHLGGTIL